MTTSLSLKLLDDRNRLFWDEVKPSYIISVLLYEGHHYSTVITGSSVKMLVPSENISKELFTHELLHLYLRKKKILITEYLMQQIKREPLLRWSLTENLMEQVGHFLEHAKILPFYLKQGFEISKFTEDYDTPVCNHMHIQRLFAGMQKLTPSPAIIDLYIHHFFAMRSATEPQTNYCGWLTDLENINPGLFFILDDFWEKWISYDITRYHPTEYSYRSFAAAFIHEIGMWTVRNMFSREKIAYWHIKN